MLSDVATEATQIHRRFLSNPRRRRWTGGDEAMKFSLTLPDDDRCRRWQHGGDPTSNHQQHPILKAKLPLTIRNHPFTSTIAATTTTPASYFTFALSTSFPSCPSLKLSYSPTAAAPSAGSPFCLSLKSGIGLFGSPNDSPLVFSAHFPLSLASPNASTPVFTLHFRPQLGHFSLGKSTSSNPSYGRDLDVNRLVELNHEENEVTPAGVSDNLGSELGVGGGFSMGGSSTWEELELKLEPCSGKEVFRSSDGVDCGRNLINGGKVMPLSCGIDGKRGNLKMFSGIEVRARTMLPITKRVRVNIRCRVNLPAADSGAGMPFLAVSKIGFETIQEAKGTSERKDESNFGDSKLLKGMFLWMRKDLEEMQRENGEMKKCLEDIRIGLGTREGPREKIGIGNRDSMNLGVRRGDFEMWKGQKSGREENVRESG